MIDVNDADVENEQDLSEAQRAASVIEQYGHRVVETDARDATTRPKAQYVDVYVEFRTGRRKSAFDRTVAERLLSEEGLILVSVRLEDDSGDYQQWRVWVTEPEIDADLDLTTRY